MREFFQNPWSDDVSGLQCDIASLWRLVSRYVDADEPRLVREGRASFGELLEAESLPAGSASPDAVLADLAPYFQGMMRWNHPGTMINVTPPPTRTSVAAAAVASLLNANGAQDMSSGLLLGVELAVVKMVAQLAGLDSERAGGVFTFGGTATNLHAIKHGVQRAQPQARTRGVLAPVRVVSSMQGHPCHRQACGWLGIGEHSCLKVATLPDGTVDLDALEVTLRATLAAGEQVATIFANGGTTIQMLIDPIAEIVALRDRLVAEFGLPYRPRVHVDSVLGWVWLFFRDYPADANPCGLPASTLRRVELLAARIGEIGLADSFGVDFHKTGFAAYATSLYMTADRQELYEQGGVTHADHPIGGGGRKGLPYEELRFGQHSPFEYTLELSRSMAGPVGAYVNLKMLGVEGYRRILGGLLAASESFSRELAASGRFEVLTTDDGYGFAVLFVAKPEPVTPSVFDPGWDRAGLEAVAVYNYDFYRFLFEQQERGRCPIACDYSSGYHSLVGGARIGVHKSFPTSPFYDDKIALEYAQHLVALLAEFDARGPEAVAGDGPHEPRPMIFRAGELK